MNVFEEIKLSNKDKTYLLEVNAIEINDKTKKITWLDDEYTGKFDDIKNACKFGDVYLIDNKVCYWLFPMEVFNYFEDVFILHPI